MTTTRRTFLSLLAALPGLGFLRPEAPLSMSALHHQEWSDRVAWRREQFAEKILIDLAKTHTIPPRILRGCLVEWRDQ